VGAKGLWSQRPQSTQAVVVLKLLLTYAMVDCYPDLEPKAGPLGGLTQAFGKLALLVWSD